MKRGPRLTKLDSALFSLVGCNDEIIRYASKTTRSKYKAIAYVFIFYFIFLVVTWSKILATYFGLTSMPFSIVLASMIIMIDKMIFLRPQKLKGSLKCFGKKEHESDLIGTAARITYGVVLAIITSLLLMLSIAHPRIEQIRVEAVTPENEVIRQEYLANTLAAYDSQLTVLSSDIERIKISITNNEDEISDTKNQIDIYTDAILQAKISMHKEKSGIDGRLKGCGPKCNGYRDIASQNQDSKVNAENKKTVLYESAEQMKRDLSKKNNELRTLEAEKESSLKEAGIVYKTDHRFQTPEDGIFADATIFLKLFSSPAERQGAIFYMIVIGTVVLIFEMAAITSMLIFPSTPYEAGVQGSLQPETESIIERMFGRMFGRGKRSTPKLKRVV